MNERVHALYKATFKAVSRAGHSLPFVVGSDEITQEILCALLRYCHKQNGYYIYLSCGEYARIKYKPKLIYNRMVNETVCNHLRHLLTQPMQTGRDWRVYDVARM